MERVSSQLRGFAGPVQPGPYRLYLASRILRKEHVLFPEAVRCFCGDLLQIDGRKVRAPEPDETR